MLVCKDEAGTELLWEPCECMVSEVIYRGQDDGKGKLENCVSGDGKCDNCNATIVMPDPAEAGNGVVLYPVYANTSKAYMYMLDYYTRTVMK
jgi:hypothetical protein